MNQSIGHNYGFKAFALSVFVSGAICGCSHGNPTLSDSTSPGTRIPASQSRLDPDDIDRIRQVVTDRDSVRFRNYLNGIREAQILVSSFDERLERITTESEFDKVYESELYCKVLNVRHLHDFAEDMLKVGFVKASELGLAHVDWYFNNMADFGKTLSADRIYADPTYPAAMGQLFRGLADEEAELCRREGCVKEHYRQLGLKFNPLVNSEFGTFIKTNRAGIAKYGGRNEPNDLKPGSCFDHGSKRKPQDVGFDWVNRSWLGAVLPKGQFVFTYDDGPHPQFTRAIRDSWAGAGMPKPAFFWLRQNATSLAPIVSELNSQGYVIGSHSERHADLGTLAKSNTAAELNAVDKQLFAPELAKLTPGDAAAYIAWRDATLDREINQSVADLSKILSKPVRYFRLPYGSGMRNDLIGARFVALNLDHFFWRVDSLDWQDKNPESVRDRVISQMKTVQKGIVLFHDIHSQSAQATQLLVNFLKSQTEFKAVDIMDLPGLKP